MLVRRVALSIRCRVAAAAAVLRRDDAALLTALDGRPVLSRAERKLASRAWLRLRVPEMALAVAAAPGSGPRPQVRAEALGIIDDRLRSLARHEMALAETRRAVHWLEASVESGAATKWTWLWLARHRSRLKESAAALDACERALSLDPTFAQARALRSSLVDAAALQGLA